MCGGDARRCGEDWEVVKLRGGGAGLLDEVERSGTRRVQTARAWPRAAQHTYFHLKPTHKFPSCILFF